ncbi:hypothetical protein L7F22_068629 [Adiantum nelumboides]|nr:hypothetical protein [Adiantum nelumboides]
MVSQRTVLGGSDALHRQSSLQVPCSVGGSLLALWLVAEGKISGAKGGCEYRACGAGGCACIGGARAAANRAHVQRRMQWSYEKGAVSARSASRGCRQQERGRPVGIGAKNNRQG